MEKDLNFYTHFCDPEIGIGQGLTWRSHDRYCVIETGPLGDGLRGPGQCRSSVTIEEWNVARVASQRHTEIDHAKADQVCMAGDVTTMFD